MMGSRRHRQILDEFVLFSDVFNPRDGPQVPWNVQATNRLALKRHDVIDVMQDAGVGGQAVCFLVHLTDGRSIDPRRCCSDNLLFSSRVQLPYDMPIFFDPFLPALLQAVEIRHPIGSLHLSKPFGVLRVVSPYTRLYLLPFQDPPLPVVLLPGSALHRICTAPILAETIAEDATLVVGSALVDVATHARATGEVMPESPFKSDGARNEVEHQHAAGFCHGLCETGRVTGGFARLRPPVTRKINQINALCMYVTT